MKQPTEPGGVRRTRWAEVVLPSGSVVRVWDRRGSRAAARRALEGWRRRIREELEAGQSWRMRILGQVRGKGRRQGVKG